jgi:hypothetical protein
MSTSSLGNEDAIRIQKFRLHSSDIATTLVLIEIAK